MSDANSPTINPVGVVRVAWFLILLSLTACSVELEGPDRREIDTRTTLADRTAGKDPASGEAATSMHVEYTVDGVLLRREEVVLNIEEATMRPTVQGDEPEVIVRTAIRLPRTTKNAC